MNSLPQEIYDQIGTLLRGPDFDRPALATISRRWQAMVERRTFRHIRLRSNDLDRFQAIIHKDRRRYVREIEYVIILPAYSDQDRCRFERDDDRRANDEAFTVAIHRLFHVLQSWDVNDGYVCLTIMDVHSISDHPFLCHSSSLWDPNQSGRCKYADDADDDADDDYRRRRRWTIVDLCDWRHRFSFLRLLRPSMLPLVPAVRDFWTRRTTRNLCDRVPIEIAAKLPNVRRATWLMNDWSIRYLALRRTHRRDLTQAVTEVLPQSSSLEDLSLNMSFNDCYWDLQNFSAGNLHPDNLTCDTLSDAIRTATSHMRRLRELRISGEVDTFLLRPGPSAHSFEPYWQNIERLSVLFAPRRPSGGNYFLNREHPIQVADTPLEVEMPPGYKQSEEEEVAAETSFSVHAESNPSVHSGLPWHSTMDVVPDNSLMPLIKAFGEACLQMPRLEAAELWTHVPASTGLDRSAGPDKGKSSWGIWYLSPGSTVHGFGRKRDPAFDEDIDQRRLIWDVKDWRPEEDLQSLLRNIGRQEYGNHLVEKFIDSWESVYKDRWIEMYNKAQASNPS